jgi:hypothetical protein
VAKTSHDQLRQLPVVGRTFLFPNNIYTYCFKVQYPLARKDIPSQIHYGLCTFKHSCNQVDAEPNNSPTESFLNSTTTNVVRNYLFLTCRHHHRRNPPTVMALELDCVSLPHSTHSSLSGRCLDGVPCSVC